MGGATSFAGGFDPHALSEQALLAQRAAVVRLCAQLTGRADVAEDLAHEALLLAWRKLATLRDPAALPAWLAAIARNVCRMWQRQQHADRRTVSLDGDDGDAREQVTAEALRLDTLTERLERRELLALVREALALLPADTRSLLLAKYGAELPTATLAARLDLSENAVAVRLHRGRQTARQIFATTLRAAASNYGLPLDEALPWRPTTLWCPHCGQQRLRLRFAAASGVLWLECPSCLQTPGGYFLRATGRLLRETGSYQAALQVMMDSTHAFCQQHLGIPRTACHSCGSALMVEASSAGLPGAPVPNGAYAPAAGAAVVYSRCLGCGGGGWAYRSELALLYHPAGQRFWQRYGRIRLAADHLVEHQGRPALRTSYAHVDGAAQLDVLRDPHSYEVLHVVEPK